MTKFDNPLANLKIASPCSADWEAMVGDNRKRFCGDCKLNVFNLSGMSKDEAENLLKNSEGRVCVRFYQRADGTVLTENCPVGWAKVKQKTKLFVTAAASLVFSFLGAIGLQPAIANAKGFGFNIPFVTPTPERFMGKVAIKPTPTPKATPKKKPKPIAPPRVPLMGRPSTPNKPEGIPTMGTPSMPNKPQEGFIMGDVAIQD
jgi:hypothetical protein